jgi:hypothetical protein
MPDHHFQGDPHTPNTCTLENRHTIFHTWFLAFDMEPILERAFSLHLEDPISIVS